MSDESQFFITFPARTMGRRIVARYRKMYWGVRSGRWEFSRTSAAAVQQYVVIGPWQVFWIFGRSLRYGR
jgi:hypothetical protein